MVGGSLMVKPVTDQYTTTVQLYLPGSNSVSHCRLDSCLVSLETHDSLPHVYIHMHARMHTYMHTCTHACIHAHMYACMHACTHTHTQIWYDYEDYTPYSGGSRYSVSAPLSKVSLSLRLTSLSPYH